MLTSCLSSVQNKPHFFLFKPRVLSTLNGFIPSTSTAQFYIPLLPDPKDAVQYYILLLPDPKDAEQYYILLLPDPKDSAILHPFTA